MSGKKCKCCKEKIDTEDSESIYVGLNWYKNIEHAIGFSREKVAKQQARDRSKANKKKKAANIKRKQKFIDEDLPHQLELTQEAFNRLRKLQEFKWFADRGLEPTCISCDRPNMDWCAGHMKSRGAQGALRFDPINVYLQCNWRCNKNLSANINGDKTSRGYLKGLADRFGEERAKEIIEYCEVDRVAEWDCAKLKKQRFKWLKEIREMEKEL